MVDLCRPSTLSTNNSIGSANSNNDINNGNSNFFPALFVCNNFKKKRKPYSFFFCLYLFQFPYSQFINPDRQECVTAALAAAVMTSSSSIERKRLEEEKLRVQAKDKKDQSNIYLFVL